MVCLIIVDIGSRANPGRGTMTLVGEEVIPGGLVGALAEDGGEDDGDIDGDDEDDNGVVEGDNGDGSLVGSFLSAR